MGLTDWQLGVVDEVTYNTPVTVSRFFEFDSESIADDPRRVEGDPLRVGGEGVIRSDRSTPYYGGASGPVSMAVLTKGFGFWLKHMLGTEATTGPTETTVYTHTGTLGNLQGDSFTLQVNRPFNPTGTNQAITYSGGKIPEWTLSNNAEENLMLELTCDFASQVTGTALATASYPTSMENFTFAGGTVSIGGSALRRDEHQRHRQQRDERGPASDPGVGDEEGADHGAARGVVLPTGRLRLARSAQPCAGDDPGDDDCGHQCGVDRSDTARYDDLPDVPGGHPRRSVRRVVGCGRGAGRDLPDTLGCGPVGRHEQRRDHHLQVR
jgi:hypothetical protein